MCYFVFVFEAINYITMKIFTDLPSLCVRRLPPVSYSGLFLTLVVNTSPLLHEDITIIKHGVS